MVSRRNLLSTAASGALVGSALGFGVGRGRGAGKPPLSHDEYPFRRNDERVQLVDANPEFGFNYPYYLATPEEFRSEPVPLMVEMNNAGRGQDLDTLKDRVKDQITRFELQGPWLSEELGVPQLIPVVPWPDGGPVDRSHIPINLNRNAMLLEGTDLDRMDLQVLSMADHARQRVLTDQQMHGKVIFYGNSSGGRFGVRISVLHPDEILAVASGGINGFVTLPLEKLGKHTLKYPVGVADLESVIGNPYNKEAHDGVDKLYFLGGEDPKNPLPMEDGLQKDEWNYQEVYDAARAVYGPRIVEDRFPRCHIAYQKAGVDAQFRLYPEMTHDPTPASHDILEFYRKSIAGEDVSEFGQRLELPLDREPEADWDATVTEVSVEYSPSALFPPPDGLVTYRWELGDGTTKTGMRVNHTYEGPGRYDVTLAMETAHGQHAQTEAEFFFEAPSFDLVEYELSAEDLQIGESVTVSATVGNTGTKRGHIPIEFSVDERPVDEASVDLAVDETEDITFEHTFENTGEFELTINNASVGTVIVRPEATQTPSSTETSAETPGFGVLAALAGIGSAVGYRLLGDDTEGD